MKKLMITMTALASALVLLFPGAAGAHHPHNTPREDMESFEFYALGHGDITGACLNHATPPVPVAADAVQSCVESLPIDPTTNGGAQEDYVEIEVKDSQNNPVYFTVQQEGNPNFGWGCGTITSHGVSSHHAWDTPPPPPPTGMYPILGAGAGGGQAPPILVFPWAGPGVNNLFNALDPNDICFSGSVDTNLILNTGPGGRGTVMFRFHNDVAP
jgi:hypothetical protein